ncbi:hypothetical protein SAMN02910298_00806 [Pseudobutyrivibrio sp. YE44]|uniref:hypothetical protein n=1 Tax=Pseudobutyrivibrio sp. YE44 TaxID=1520802 RepID=UPI000890F8E2|nr:hypothetical protein [Pseudobutyrivibrio sp. YE44]SDB15078.1 hypothetical protein SAMN02910298_00806 [Pseudobutyrivibrio sp. YE44]
MASKTTALTSIGAAQLARSAMRRNASKKAVDAFNKLEAEAAACEQKQKELEAMQDKLAEQATRLAEAEAEAEAAEIRANTEIEYFKQQNDVLNKQLLQKQVEDEKRVSAFNTEDISDYLNQVIKDFNDSNASDSNIATYVINNMEVDLKVRVFGEETKDAEDNTKKVLKLIAPSIAETSEDSLSSIKISIQAVPK